MKKIKGFKSIVTGHTKDGDIREKVFIDEFGNIVIPNEGEIVEFMGNIRKYKDRIFVPIELPKQ